MSTPPPDDPSQRPGATILRPRPGRRPGTPVAPSTASPSTPPPTQFRGGAGAPQVGELASTGSNPLLRLAVPLLVLSSRFRGQIANADAQSVRAQCIQELRTFDERARQAGVSADEVIAARYAICAALDEAVLATPWGAQSAWPQESLLLTLHKERRGGEKFFQILEELAKDPVRHRDALEIYYVCIALGFEGRYALDPRGAAQLDDIRKDAYRRLAQVRGGVESELSTRWKGVEDRRNVVMRLVPLWVVALACLVILIGAWIFFNARLNTRAAELNATLAGIGVEPPLEAAPVATAAPPSGIAGFLAPQIAQHLVQVTEQGGRTLIILTVPDLFASGSPRLNARYEELVHQVGAALNTVSGRVMVTGHTDDQPVHSFQFSDNYALSRARAANVASLIGRDIKDAGRIESVGKGDSDPLFKPPSVPENRARNRRVEIVNNRTG